MRVSRRLSLAALLALAAPFVPTAAWAAPLPVSACGKVITTPGSYALTKSLTCAGTAISIEATGVKLALMGHTITGPGDDAGAVGIEIGDGDADLTGVSVAGPGKVTGFGMAVRTFDLHYSRIDGVTLTGNGFGLIVSANGPDLSTGNTFSNLYVSENEIHGVTFNGVTKSVFVNNHLDFNGGDGLLLYWATKNVVRGNQLQDNQDDGIHAEAMFTSGNMITDNDVLDSGDFDLVDENPVPLNAWFGNVFETANRDYIS